MSSLLLQINLDLQAGAAINMLNTIESSVDKIIGKLQQFSQFFSSNPINIVQSKQLDIASNLISAVQRMDDIGMSINESSIEELARRKQILDISVAQAQKLKNQTGHVQGLNDALLKQVKYENQFDDFRDKAKKFDAGHKKQIDLILKNQANRVKFSTAEVAEFKQYTKALEIAVKLGGDHCTKLGISAARAKELHDAMSQVTFDDKEHVSSWEQAKQALSKFTEMIPGTGILIATLTNPLSVITNSLGDMKDLWETNNKVSNNFLFGATGQADRLGQSLFDTMKNISTAGGGMRDEFKELGIELGDNIVTLDQTKKAVNAVLASSYKGVLENNKQLGIYASLTAQAARATGVSDAAMADLILKYSMLSDTIGGVKDPSVRMRQSAVLTDTLVNITDKYHFSVEETGHVVSLLNRDMMFLNKNYKVSAELTKLGITPASVYATTLSALGDAAKKAGHDSKTAMDAFASAIEDPLNNVLLLGSALRSNDPAEQMLAMGKNAGKFAAMIEKNPMLRGQARAMFGKSYEELKAMSDANTELTKTAKKNADGSVDVVAMNKDMADSSKAAATKAKMNADANNQMTAALDGLRIIFGQIASALQPLISGFAWLLSIPFMPYIIAITGGLIALYAVMKNIGIIKSFGSALSGVGDAAKNMIGGVKGGKGGGMMKGFTDGLKQMVDGLKSIDTKGAIKAAINIAILGAGLAVGIGAIGLASKLMDAGKMGELLIAIGGIVAVSYLLSKMGSIGKSAMQGAGYIAVIGVALGIGVAAIGLASKLINPDVMGSLAMIIGGMLTTMLLLTFIGPIGAPALMGALFVAAVGVALGIGVAAMGLASKLINPDVMGSLAIMVGGMLATMVVLAFMGPIGAPALIGALFVAAVGAALAIGIAAIGLASKLINPEATGALLAIVGGLLASMVVLALMGPLAIPALFGALALIAIGAALSLGIVMIAGASKLIDKDTGEKLSELAKGIGFLATTAVTGPLALIGATSMAVAAPLLAFAMMAIGAATAAFGDSAIQAITGLANAMGGIPAGAGAALVGMAVGLTAFAAALTGGAIFSFFSGGIVNNAKEMAVAMNTLLGPIVALGSIGDQVSKSFVSIADGLKVFVEAINDSSGWFSSFEGKAEKVASAMRKIAEPMKDMGGGPGAAGSEEIKKSLALTIESANNSNKEILEELKAIRKSLEVKSDANLGDKMDQSVDVLKKILQEMVFGGGFGATSANGDYNG
jgi:hypothetical protein